MTVIVPFHDPEDPSYYNHALRFLAAVRVSKAGWPRLVAKSIVENPVTDSNELRRRIVEILEDNGGRGGWYQGFRFLQKDGRTDIYWGCAHSNTIISLGLSERKQWRILVESDSSRIANSRIKAAREKDLKLERRPRRKT